MTPERWRRVEAVFHAASARPPDERDRFLDAECGGDSALRQEIESLLQQQSGDALRARVIAAAVTVATSSRGGLSGSALGPYALGPLLGVGGMCDVYRAHDVKLGRDVAVKILPETFDQSSDRLARFEREARILAALNHPNIAAIYGIEANAGIRGLVLELVDGITLKERIARGALPVSEALSIASQIADAFAAAHEKGIVHRDLKPANVQITSRGLVKVLDFGLAKTVDSSLQSIQSVLTTADGLVLGTVAYMSPEQARGLPVDKRTDIWAFGCVLYEMLTGARPFAGDLAADVLGAITNLEPDWALLPSEVPGRVRNLLRRCLTKDPDRRLHDVTDARIEIDATIAGEEDDVERVVPFNRAGRRLSTRASWMIRGTILIGAVLGLWVAFSGRVSERRTASFVSIELPPDVAVALGDARGSSVAVSPDGRLIAYAAVSSGRTQLYLRALDRIDSTPISGTDGATSPFFSPNGRWVAFHADGKLKKVPVQGGAVSTIVEDVSRQRGAAWGANENIVFVPERSERRPELWRVPATGGMAERITTLAEGETSHGWPAFLPDGETLLYTIWNNTGPDSGRIVVQSPDGGRAVLVERATYGRVAVVGRRRAYLVYARSGGLLAASIDLTRRRVTGPEIPVLNGVMTNMSGGAHFSFSGTGVFAYVPGQMNELGKTPLWVSRDGATTELATIPGLGTSYSLSPDGRRLARPAAEGPARDIWIDDLVSGQPSVRLTFDGFRGSPIWTPDGRRVIYTGGAPTGNLFWRAADFSDNEDRLTTSPNQQLAGSVSPDGTTLAYTEAHPERGFDIWLLPLKGTRTPRPFLVTPANEGNPRFSPDGRWLAFMSNLSGRTEIYLAPFPEGDLRIPVSRGFGADQLWSSDGRELFYRRSAAAVSAMRRQVRDDNEMVAVSIDTTGAQLKVGAPRVLFRAQYLGSPNVAPDGRFLLLKPTPQESTTRVIQLVQDWFDELERLAAPPSAGTGRR